MNSSILQSIGKQERIFEQELLRRTCSSMSKEERFTLWQGRQHSGLLYCIDRQFRAVPQLERGVYLIVPHIPSGRLLCRFVFPATETGQTPGVRNSPDDIFRNNEKNDDMLLWETFVLQKSGIFYCRPEEAAKDLAVMSEAMLLFLPAWLEQYKRGRERGKVPDILK